MAATTYECTECGAQLKSPQVFPEGKKVRCTKCNQVFTIGNGAAAPASKAAVASPAQAAAPAQKEDEEDEGGFYVVAPEVAFTAPTDAELSAKKKPDDDDDSEDDDGKPSKKKKKKGQKKAKAGSSGGSGKIVALVVVGVLLVLLLAGGGIGAYVYLNWYKNKGTGKENPLALLPADSKAYGYINVGALSGQPATGPLVDQLLKSAVSSDLLQRIKAEAGVDPKDLMDQVYSGTIPPDGAKGGKIVTNTLFISKVPFDQNKMRLAFKDAEPERYKWRTYFKLKEANGPTLAYMASNHLILFSDGPETSLQALIEANSSQPNLPAETMSMIQTMESEEAWMVLPLDNNAREGMKAMGAMLGMKMTAGVEAGLAKANMMGFGAKLSGSQVKITASFHCSDDAAAKHLSENFSTMWDRQKGLMGLGLAGLGKSGSALIKELTQSMHFSSKGSYSQSAAQVGLETVKDLVAEASQAPAQQRSAVPAGRRGAAGGAGRGGRGGP